VRDMDDEQTPSERDEQIYAAWESGKTPRACAREFGVSRTEAECAIDRCLPVFNSKTEMMAYKRERQKLDDIGSKYHAQAMAGDIDSGHLYARINERRCAMSGWTSVNVRLDPYTAQSEQAPSSYERITAAVRRISQRHAAANGGDGNGQAALVDGRSNSEPVATPNGPERDTDAT